MLNSVRLGHLKGLTPNLVFVRDPLCACYHIAPDGTPTGLAYYEARVREAVEKLGARHNVAIGTSIGGMAAVAFGHRVGFDQVIAFSPSWPPERYMLDNSLAGLVARAKLLIRRPGAWIERLLLGHMARISAERLRDAVGADVLDLEAELATSTSLPDLTVYLDIDAGSGLARKQGGPAEEWNRFEQKQLAYHQQVRQGYLELAAAEPARWLVVDAADSVESVHRQLAATVAERGQLPAIPAE